MPDTLLTIFIFTFGIVMGSFLNVLIYGTFCMVASCGMVV